MAKGTDNHHISVKFIQKGWGGISRPSRSEEDGGVAVDGLDEVEGARRWSARTGTVLELQLRDCCQCRTLVGGEQAEVT